MKPEIIPAILTPRFEDFASQIKKLEPFSKLAQIDVMDGEFVAGSSFTDVEKINGLKTKLNFELHLMVKNPLQEMEKWMGVKNITRVIFHLEAAPNPQKIINTLRGKCAQVGLAVNPETPLTVLEPYYKLVDVVLFMTVHPGEQGAKFLPEVGDKIKEFNKLTKNSNHRPLVAVDGGINKHNIAGVKSWGVDIFYVGSALTQAKNLKKSYEELIQLI
ncbi:MAG: hypothetical protein AAB678_00630 [Patescibacteria group bacterium]